MVVGGRCRERGWPFCFVGKAHETVLFARIPGQGMPSKLEHMALTDEGTEPPSEGVEAAIPLDTVENLMENLKQFTDSLHQKASQVVHWMNQSEPLQTDRSKKPLVESFLLA